MFSSKSLLCLAVAGAFWTAPLVSQAATPQSAQQAESTALASYENTLPAEAFRVLPPPDAEGPQITPYLLYQTSLAWHQDGLPKPAGHR